MALYYIGDVAYDGNYLEHHGIKGMKWGVRRFQNPDGTWTEEGKKRYGGDSNGLHENVDKYHKKSENQARWRENKESAKDVGSSGPVR